GEQGTIAECGVRSAECGVRNLLRTRMSTLRRRSAGFRTCCIAGFQTRRRPNCRCAQSIFKLCRLGSRRYSRFGNLRYACSCEEVSFHGVLYLPESVAAVRGETIQRANLGQGAHLVFVKPGAFLEILERGKGLGHAL